MAKIVIDAAHTGEYNKGVCAGYYEGNAMLKLAKYLGEDLRQYGADVVYTRTTDAQNPGIAERGRMGAGADLFISLHSNASENSTIRGVDSYYSVRRPQSREFAMAIGMAAAEAMGTPFRSALTQTYPNDPSLDYFGVIRYSVEQGAKHSILIEHGFHTNQQDCLLLNNDAVLRRIAAAEAKVIANKFGLSIEVPPELPKGCQCAFPYTVRSGDSLYAIGDRFGIPWQNIALANNLTAPYTLQVGQQITIPFQGVFPYTVRSGDSLFQIGERFGVPWQNIAQANNLSAPYTLQTGQLLIIPFSNVRKSHMDHTGRGYLKVSVRTADDAMPIENARVRVKSKKGKVLYETTTDANGNAKTILLPAPEKKHTLYSNYPGQAYAVYDVDIKAPGYVTLHIHNVEIVDTQTAILTEQLKPLVDEPNPVMHEDIDIAPPAVTLPTQRRPEDMGKGYLKFHVRTADDAMPVKNACVTVKSIEGKVLYETTTDADGDTKTISLPAPNKKYTLDPNFQGRAYAAYDVDISHPGYVNMHIHNVEIVDTQTTILTEQLKPLVDEPNPEMDEDIDIAPPAVTLPIQRRQSEVPPQYKAPAVIDFDIMQRQLKTSGDSSQYTANTNYIENIRATFSPKWDFQEPGTVPSNNNRATRETSNPTTGPEAATLGGILIPDYITVHLGIPTNSAARNVRIRFIDYIKNVASSEIYPTWPRNSLIANIHVIVTFALNRIYTEWYTSRGYPFNITNSTAYDQAYRDGGPVFSSISVLVDQYFNTYAHRAGVISPFFTSFCNGTTSTCAGLSQWGTVPLANEGKTPLEILRNYYPKDIVLSTSNNIGGITESYPGTVMAVGSQGEAVRKMQNYLNRIRANFPNIPLISNPNGVFGEDTANAVRVFQRTFDLSPDGVIGRGTWNKISYIFAAVARLAELDSEGERYSIGLNPPSTVLSQGSKGRDVNELQFILNAIAPYYPSIPTVIMDSTFDYTVKNAVIEFQKAFGLPADGVVGPVTWNKLYAVYRGVKDNAPAPPPPPSPPPSTTPPQYPGTPLRVGSTGANVRLMQTYLNAIRAVYPYIPPLIVDSIFGEQTKAAVTAFQNFFGLTPDGIIGPVTWNAIVDKYQLVTNATSTSFEYPGLLRVGSRGNSVSLMQSLLLQLSKRYTSIPYITADGIFGPRTEAAVIAFQGLFGLSPDGIVGPLTWNRIVSEYQALTDSTSATMRVFHNDCFLIGNAVSVPLDHMLK